MKINRTNGESFVLMFLILVEMFWQMQINEVKMKKIKKNKHLMN